MRFLKKKIQRALEFHNHKLLSSLETSESLQKPVNSGFQSVESSPISKPKIYRRHRNTKEKKSHRKPSSTKNMSINFGKAISSFATSLLALPYLEPQLEKHGLTYTEFVNFVMSSKGTIGSIESFRNLLVSKETDEVNVATYKKIIGYLSEIFIKYFSVNWIIHGKVAHKLVYLKYRFKMLRRIRNPEHFTYVTKRTGAKKTREKVLI